jgi:hypothetical protein
MKFNQWVKELPDNCTVRIRIADNVLDDDDYRVDELTIRSGVVISQRTVHPGIYQIPNKIGFTTRQLCAWSHYESAEHYHPMEFHEIAIMKGGV